MRLLADPPISESWAKNPRCYLPLAKRDKGAYVLLQHLLSLEGHERINNQGHLANLCGYKLDNFRKYFTKLVNHGVLRTDGDDVLILPYEEGEREEQVAPPEAKTIIKEVDAEPRRQSTGMSEKDRQAMLVKAWNEHKPENMESMERMHPSVYIALMAHTKFLKVDRDSDQWLRRVFTAMKASDYWQKAKGLKAWNVFGFGEPKDKQFQMVSRLYNEGDREIGFEWTDAAVLKWFNGVDKSRRWTSVEWVTYDRVDEKHGHIPMWVYNQAADVEEDLADTTIRVYTEAQNKHPDYWLFKKQSRFMYRPN